MVLFLYYHHCGDYIAFATTENNIFKILFIHDSNGELSEKSFENIDICPTHFIDNKLDNVPEKWDPYCPSALEHEDMHFWSCGTTTFDFIQVEDVYAKDDKVLENMW